MQKIRLGIVGAGRLGSFHADKAAAHASVQLVGVQDPSEKRRKELAAKHQIPDFAQPSELLPLVDAVVIAAPTENHHALGVQFLSKGVHVLMEKPLAISGTEAEELVDLARSKRAILQVGHVEQFNPAWSTAAPVLDLVREGKRAVINAERSSGYTFRSTDIGVVHDLMIHDLELIFSVVPSAIRSIDASGFRVIGSREQKGWEDIAYARIAFENGTIANLRASRVDQQAIRVQRIQTAHLSAEIDFGSRQTRILRASGDVVNGMYSPKVFGSKDPAEHAKNFMQSQFSTLQIEQEAVDALSLEMNDFAIAILTGQSPRVPGEQALKAVLAADAILRSIAENEQSGRRLSEAA